MPRGNRTERRGHGPPPVALKITLDEARALRALLMERHGYSAEEALAGLLSGELATVLLGDEERRHAIRALEASGDEVLIGIARQLRTAAALEEE